MLVAVQVADDLFGQQSLKQVLVAVPVETQDTREQASKNAHFQST